MRQSLKVDTGRLQQYAQRLDRVTRRLDNLDSRLKGLYHRVGLAGLMELIQSDSLTGYNWPIRQCSDYLRLTAEDFERTERRILKKDPVNFRGFSSVEELGSDMWKNLGTLGTGFGQQLGKDLMTIGPLLGWIDAQYEDMKKENLVCAWIDNIIGDEVKDVYTVCSGIMQGDLSVDEGLDVLSNMASDLRSKEKIKTPYTKAYAGIKTLRYALAEDTAALDKKAQEKLKQQLLEMDVIGSLGACGEALVDEIGGGVIEVFAGVGGMMVDSVIEKEKKWPYVGNLVVAMDTICKQKTGMSPGEIIEEAGSRISTHLDHTTDEIFRVLDGANDAIRAEKMKIFSKLVDLIR